MDVLENIMQTSILFLFIFFGVRQIYGDDNPHDVIKTTIVTGIFSSLGVLVISSFLLIWRA